MDPNFLPLVKIQNEPFAQDAITITNDDYLKIVGKLNEFADSTMTLGEALLKKIDEITISDNLIRETADRIAKNSAEISQSSISFLKRTKDAIA